MLVFSPIPLVRECIAFGPELLASSPTVIPVFDDLLLPASLPYSIALALLAVTSVIQIGSALIGLGTFDFLDGWLPDLEVDLDVGDVVDVDGLEGSFFEGLLAWLNLGKVPFIITFNLFLFCFAAGGFLVLAVGQRFGLATVPWVISVPLALVGTVLPIRWGNALAARIWPRDETAAVESDRFVGRVATITIGTATHERPAEAKLKGPLGRLHYVMVAADDPAQSFAQGSQVLLVGRRGAWFTGISVTNDNLKP